MNTVSLSNILGAVAGMAVSLVSARGVIWPQKVADHFNEINSQRPRWRAYRHRTALEVRVIGALSLALGLCMLVLGLSGSFA